MINIKKCFAMIFICLLFIASCKKKEELTSSDLVLHHISYLNFNYFNSVAYFNYDNNKKLTRIWWGMGNGNLYSKINYTQNQLQLLVYNSGFNRFDTTFYPLNSAGLAASNNIVFNANGQIIKTTNDDSLVYNSEGVLLYWYRESKLRKDSFTFYDELTNKGGIYQFDEWSPIWMTGIFGLPQKKLIKKNVRTFNGHLQATSNYSYVFDDNGFVIKTIINNKETIKYSYVNFDKNYESP